MLFLLELPFLNSAFDLITITFISALIIWSVLSLCFIFHLHFKSKFLRHLQGFNSLWTVRFLLVLFIFLWAITELFRLPILRRKYLHIFLPSLTLSQQANLCKIHIILSLGFFEPAFLITLLFLLNASIKKKSPRAITFVFLTCIPLATFQTLIIFFNPMEKRVPGLFHQTSVVFNDSFGSEVILCAYPFLNSVIFAGFGVVYPFRPRWFLFSCWRVLSLVINKGLRVRIYSLALAVLIAVPLQVVSLGFTMLWSPHDEMYDIVSLLVFLGAFCCAAMGEGILVIKPISDALDAGGMCSLWRLQAQGVAVPT